MTTPKRLQRRHFRIRIDISTMIVFTLFDSVVNFGDVWEMRG